MKIKLNSDDNLPLDQTLKIHNMEIVIRSVFEQDGKYYYPKGSDYRIHFWCMSKHDAINKINSSNVSDKRDVL